MKIGMWVSTVHTQTHMNIHIYILNVFVYIQDVCIYIYIHTEIYENIYIHIYINWKNHM